ncbi:MAG: hypothetical protein WAO76_04180, partial [Georgfuchsia sp.]
MRSLNRTNSRSLIGWLKLAAVGLSIATLAACGSDGSNGSQGAQGAQGPQGEAGTPADPAALDALTAQVTELAQAANPESCATCHTGATPVAESGSGHQAVYDQYNDATKLAVTIDDVTTAAGTSTMTFTATYGGVDMTAADVNACKQKRLYAATYDSATRKFNTTFSYSAGTLTDVGPGQMTVTGSSAWAPETSNAQVYIVLQCGEQLEGTSLYDDVINVGKTYGDANTYASTANVSGCENCHGAPFLKAGYRGAEAIGLQDFAACKSCHYDTKTGGHQDWQLLKDDPAKYADYYALAKAATASGDSAHNSVKKNMTADELTEYAYTANVMSDVHMSHNMEFPYPQSMRNCKTCHDGKLDLILTDANFKPETCISCHSLQGIKDKMAAANYNHSSIIATTAALKTTDCSAACHTAGGGAPMFADIHSGYDPKIYTDAGVK